VKVVDLTLVCFIVQCTHCSQLVIHPDQRFNFFSDYSQTVSCPHCGVQDFHFTKPLTTYVSRDELTKVTVLVISCDFSLLGGR
jgi:hypothetical protein